MAGSDCDGCVCIPTTFRGIISRCALTAMCHVFIRMRSSNVNSNTKRPSVHTLKRKRHHQVNSSCALAQLTFVYMGLEWCVTIVHCSQSSVIDVL